MSDVHVPDPVVLSCGCLIRCALEEGVRTMFLIPCRKGCENVRKTLVIAVEQGKNIEHRKGP